MLKIHHGLVVTIFEVFFLYRSYKYYTSYFKNLKKTPFFSCLLFILLAQHMVTCRDKTKLSLIVLLQLSVTSSKTGEYIHIQIFLKCNNNASALIQLLLNHANINRKYNLIFLLNHIIYYHQQRVCLLFAPAQSKAKALPVITATAQVLSYILLSSKL